MKKTLLAIFIAAIGISTNAQTITTGNFISEYCPQYMSTGGTTRMATYFKAFILGLNPGETYYYTIRACAYSDFGTSYGGVGGSLFLDKDSATKYVSSPSFTAGNFDSFTVLNPLESRWFGFVNSTNTRFNAGNYVYPMLTIKSAMPGSPFSARFVLNDSIKTLSLSTSAGINNGSGIYGLSEGNSKEFVFVYDTNISNPSPITIGMIEDDKLDASDYSAASFYDNNADGIAGAWGGVLPNTLPNGVRRIERRDFEFGTLLHTNIDTNGVWLNVNTKDPRGGNTSPIKLGKDEAALVPTQLSIVQPFPSISEGGDSFNVLVRRKYSTEDTAKVTLNLIGGTAINASDFNFTSGHVFSFAPGPELIDSFKFAIIDDNLTEGNEVVTLKLQSPINTTLSKDSTLSLTIIDNDVPTISFVGSTIITREGLGDAIAKISIANGTTGTTTVDAVVKSKGLLTTIPGEFYLSANSSNDTTVSFSNGIAADTFSLNGFIVDETSIDFADTITIVLRNPSGIALIGADSLFTFIIKDDDAPPGVRFITASQNLSEKVGSIDVQVELLNRNNNPSDFSLQYIAARSVASEGSDFTFNPTSKIFSFGTSGSDTITVNIPILDDDIFESDELIVMAVSGTVNCINYLPDTLRLTIDNDDKERATIANASATNLMTGELIRINDNLRITGVTHGFNRKSTGNEFTLIDGTGGIQVFSNNEPFAYTFKEGDSITVSGTISQINGVAQMSSLDTIILHKPNATLNTPATINSLSELSEQELVRLTNLKFYDVLSWPSTAIAADQEALAYALNSIGDTVTVRIDAEGPLNGTTAPSLDKYYTVVGIGSQNDISNPFTSGYYIDPSLTTGLELVNSPEVNFSNAAISASELDDSTAKIIVNFANTGSQTVGFSIEDQLTGTASTPKDYSFSPIDVNVLPTVTSFSFQVDLKDNNDEDGSRTIKIVLRNPKYGVLIGNDSIVTITIGDDESSINTLSQAGVTMYPNPAKESITLKTIKEIDNIEIFNSLGKKVLAPIFGNKIDITRLSTGVYNILVTIEGVAYSAQFIKD